MPRNAGGAFTTPPGSDAVSLASISSAAYNAFLDDIESELTDSWSRSGKGAALANLSMGSHKLTDLAAAVDPADAVRFDQLAGFLATDPDLVALAALTTTGLLVRTGAGTATTRAVTAGAGIAVANGDGVAGAPTVAVDLGKQTLWIPAGAINPRLTNGCASLTVAEMATNKNLIAYLGFSGSTQQFGQFDVRMPKSWDEGTVSFIPVFSHGATTVNFGVVWGLDAVAIMDDGAQDVAFGTAQTSTKVGGTTDDSYQGPESAAITVAGSPTAGAKVMFRIHRDPANASDNMAVDARLEGIVLLFNINAMKDD